MYKVITEVLMLFNSHRQNRAHLVLAESTVCKEDWLEASDRVEMNTSVLTVPTWKRPE